MGLGECSKMFAFRVVLPWIIVISFTAEAFALDSIPENLSEWTEQGVVLRNSTDIAWEKKPGIAVVGVAKVGQTYYLHYLAGFDGCWNSDGDVNHQSLGLATSTDGINFIKNANNPLLKPHDFVSVSSHEEGIRTAYIQYLPSRAMFYGYFGVESPGGAQTCNFGGGGTCGCDIGVDARVYGATSPDGEIWSIRGEVDGTYAEDGNEVYASGWVFDGNDIGLYVTVAEGGQLKSASRGSDPWSLNELGAVSALNWGWSGLDTYLHDDNDTITLIYNPSGGGHPGSSNDSLYFATTHLSNMKNIQNERVVQANGGTERNIILRDVNEWKWFYSEEPAWNDSVIKLRTHPISQDSIPPAAPKNLSIENLP
ncbi:MAG: hypothetical protein R3C68_06615 [Myxococcota bacterium]